MRLSGNSLQMLEGKGRRRSGSSSPPLTFVLEDEQWKESPLRLSLTQVPSLRRRIMRCRSER